MKLNKIILTIILVLSICFCQFAGCGDEEIPEPVRDPTFLSFAEWDSQFTEEQHIANIESRAQGFLISGYGNRYSQQHNYKVYIIYSLDETPRFFMVEWFSYNSIDQVLEYSFFDIGFIYQDEYYFLDQYDETSYKQANPEENVFREENVLDCKKYIGKVFCAYRDGDDLICLNEKPGEHYTDYPDYKEIITEEMKKEFIIENYPTTYFEPDIYQV